jgi:hypothetical protein
MAALLFERVAFDESGRLKDLRLTRRQPVLSGFWWGNLPATRVAGDEDQLNADFCWVG